MSEHDLSRRVDDLEARCRQYQILALTIVCLVVAAGIVGWSSGRASVSAMAMAETIRTERVVLVDSTGARAADLSADEAGVEVRLFRPDVEVRRTPDGHVAQGEVVDARLRFESAPSLILTDGAGNAVGRLGSDR